jgi:hypothetical protein
VIVILPTQVQFPQVTCGALKEYIAIMASSLVVDRPCALKILGFTLGTILKIEGKYLGVFPGQCKLEKK